MSKKEQEGALSRFGARSTPSLPHFLVAFTATLIAVALVLGSAACSGPSDCEVFCEKELACCPAGSMCYGGGSSVSTCVATCQQLSKDAAYASALANAADCYSDSDCNTIQSGACENPM